jgi:hypothetical protein
LHCRQLPLLLPLLPLPIVEQPQAMSILEG